MEKTLQLSLILLFMVSALTLFSQEQCKILNPNISGTYQGKCKKGLANGKGVATGTDRYQGQFRNGLPDGYGTYIWAGGNEYTGEWIKGMRHGIGRYTMRKNGNDSIQDGQWQEDKYMGPKPPNPTVIYNSGIGRNTFQKNNTTKLRVLIDFYQNGNRNLGISNFLISTTSGSDAKL